MTSTSNQPSKVAATVVPPGQSIRSITRVISWITALAWFALNAIMFTRLGIVGSMQRALISAILVTVVLIGCSVAGFVVSKRDVVLGLDAPKGEVILATRYFDRPVKTRRFTMGDIQGIRIWCRDGLFRRTWNAELQLGDGRQVHLARTQGATEVPPAKWMRRFEVISGLLDRPLK